MRPDQNFLAQSNLSDELKEKMKEAQSSDELVKMVNDTGLEENKASLSYTMRTIAAAELESRGFPEWAINSIFLGEPVCW